MLKNSLKGAAIAAAVASFATLAISAPAHAGDMGKAKHSNNGCSGKNGCKGKDPNHKP